MDRYRLLCQNNKNNSNTTIINEHDIDQYRQIDVDIDRYCKKENIHVQIQIDAGRCR